jgi:hypothetical protein
LTLALERFTIGAGRKNKAAIMMSPPVVFGGHRGTQL